MNDNTKIPGFAGRTYREVPSRKSEPPKPASGEGVPNILTPVKQHPVSAGRGDLLPAFSRFSHSLDAQLAADEALRRSTVVGALNLDAKADPSTTRAQLAKAVQEKAISETEARALWSSLHGDRDPGAA